MGRWASTLGKRRAPFVELLPRGDQRVGSQRSLGVAMFVNDVFKASSRLE